MKRLVLSESIFFLEDFLTCDLREKILQQVDEATDQNEAFGGTSVTVSQSVAKFIEERLIAFGVEFKKLVHARIRVVTGETHRNFRSLVHTDHNCQSALVVYVENTLYKNAEESGTFFWEHRQSGARKLDLKNPKKFLLQSLILDRDTKDLENWTAWNSIRFQENAAVLFESSYFHSPPSPEAEKHDKGKRITLDIFLD